MKKIKISVWVNEAQLKNLAKKLGVDDSKAIRASMNCCENVLQGFFGGEVGNIFRRKKTDEEANMYEDP